MRAYLGVDGGGSKTLFLLIDQSGRILAAHAEGTAYYPEIGLEALKKLLARGIAQTLRQGSISVADLGFAFLGLPSYGEDSALLATLDAAPSSVLPTGRYRCGNDMVCGWAGALGGTDGINVAVGTGSIAYGEYAGRSARGGGWGELFSDEGSAYWLAREGLRLFSRMSDGRVPRGALHELVRRHFVLQQDLDLCAAIYGKRLAQRSQFAQLSRLVIEAATAGDTAARALFMQAAGELSDIIDAVRNRLQVPPDVRLTVSYSGGMFESNDLLLAPLKEALAAPARNYSCLAARLPSDAGAAVHAARLSGAPLDNASIAALETQLQSRRGTATATEPTISPRPTS
ncbi:MAG: N-acetylglucosamine kinase [Gammaproteobacteria bacterium]|nr:N-acetylglucosamine kinase [Gammaproteobacteria bacterium]